jgi:hypothetical protein
VQLIWALPGAKDFRWSCADVCVRYLGGDTTLVEEVFRNRAAQERLAEEDPSHPARMFGEDVEAASRKRKRDEELDELRHARELEETRAALKRIRCETCRQVICTYRELGEITPLDARKRQFLGDFVHSHISGAGADEPGRRELCVRAFLHSKGARAETCESAFGRKLARLKRQDLCAKGLPEDIPKKLAYVNGQQMEVNLYYEDDLPLFEEAWRSLSQAGGSADIRSAFRRSTAPHQS